MPTESMVVVQVDLVVAEAARDTMVDTAAMDILVEAAEAPLDIHNLTELVEPADLEQWYANSLVEARGMCY
jgi:hypothetical protein